MENVVGWRLSEHVRVSRGKADSLILQVLTDAFLPRHNGPKWFGTRGVGGSKPLSPTILFKHLNCNSGFPATSLQAKLRE